MKRSKEDLKLFLNVKFRRLCGRLRGMLMSFDVVRQLLLPLGAALSVLLGLIFDLHEQPEPIAFYVLCAFFALILLYKVYDIVATYRKYAYGYRITSAEAEQQRIRAAWQLSDPEAQDGYAMHAYFNGRSHEYYLESDSFQQLLASGLVMRFQRMKAQYTLPDDVKPYVLAILSHMFSKPQVVFNGKLLRQASHIDPKRPIVQVQMVRYFHGQCSHEIVYKQFISPDTIGIAFHGSKLLLDDDGKLYDLTHSPNANFLGVSTLVFTRGHIILTKQGDFSKANRGRYAPSGSGSVEYSDIRHAHRYHGARWPSSLWKAAEHLSFNDILTYAMEREFCEECNFHQASMQPRLHTMLVGYVRLMERGGKPDYFGISYFDWDIPQDDAPDRSAPAIKTAEQMRLYELGLTDRAVFLPYQHIQQIPDIVAQFIEAPENASNISIQLFLLAKYLKQMQASGVLEDRMNALMQKRPGPS